MLIIRIKKSAFLAGICAVLFSMPMQASLKQDSSKPGAFPEKIGNYLNVQSVDFDFIKNEGQADSRISYYINMAAGMAFITSSGELLYALNRRSTDGSNKKIGTLREQFKNGNANPVGHTKSTPRISYYLGNSLGMLRNRSTTYNSVNLGEVWPGIDISLHSYNSRVEKYIEIQPWSDISLIQVQISYAQSLKIQNDGNLVVSTDNGPVIFNEPYAYQIKGGTRISVPVTYQVDNLTYGFQVKDYDPSVVLIIDPLIMVDSYSN